MGRPERRGLGFAGLIRAGVTPEEAWAEIRAEVHADPDTAAIITDLASTPEGRGALEWSRLQWAQHGLEPPWELP